MIRTTRQRGVRWFGWAGQWKEVCPFTCIDLRGPLEKTAFEQRLECTVGPSHAVFHGKYASGKGTANTEVLRSRCNGRTGREARVAEGEGPKPENSTSEEAALEMRRQTGEGLISCDKDSGFYHERYEKALEGFEQRSDIDNLFLTARDHE